MLTNVDLIWPVYSIYFSTANVNPSEYFGGKWTLWGSGRVPVCVDTSQTEFNSSEKTGGSKELQEHFHKGLNWNNNQTGKEDISLNDGGTNGYYLNYGGGYKDGQGKGICTNSAGTGNSGNLQPYITCYMWKRIA